MKNCIFVAGVLIASTELTGCSLVGFGTGTLIDRSAKSDLMTGDQLDASVVGKTVFIYEGRRESKGLAVDWTPEYTVIMNKEGEKTLIDNTPETTVKLKRPTSTGRIVLTALGLAWDVATVTSPDFYDWWAGDSWN